ncbi:MAG: L-aspartate oxidase, partial [Myxococcales bacterium]|nr:L-aspartate oxidase [Myxococcales bacterium]
MIHRFDVVVMGSGLAGMSLAVRMARHGSVALVTKRQLEESNTNYAQGGIATVLSETDSFEAHVHDTLVAGAGLCLERIVRLVVEGGPERIQELIDWGVRFSQSEKDGKLDFDLTREGGHTERRVLHAGDITGREVVRALSRAVREHPNIEIYENHIAVDLITRRKTLRQTASDDRCLGAYVLDIAGQRVETFLGNAVVLATGGAGKVYLYTSNPDVATGDGVAMAHRAGAKVANMEFYQFHPTCLYHPAAKSFLISEALRGEGGILRRMDGTAFMADYHEMKDLAPRDIVARAIDSELKKTGNDHVTLDMTHLDGEFLARRFPNIHGTCMQFGVDMRERPIPVVPAAHYMVGGVVTDDRGRTNLPGLYACGEVSCTGLHGANRLASNSLLEATVISYRLYEALSEGVPPLPDGVPVPEWDPGKAKNPDELVIVSQNWDEIRRFMWN